MLAPSSCPTEEQRLAALAAYELMDTPPEPEFEEISFLAASLFRTPVALVSLVDRDRQFFKSVVGDDYPRETPRGMSFCNFAVLSQSTVVIEDATRDPRVADNPLVTGGPGIRFYAGAPLITPDGHAVGTVCAIDFHPHHDVSANDIKALQYLATQTMRQMELRRLKRIEDVARRTEHSLAQSEERFRLLVNSITDYAIYMLDRGGNVTSWNTGAERLNGYRADEVTGKHIDRFYTPDDRQAGAPSRSLQIAVADGRYEEEGWQVRKDGSRFWAEILIKPVRDATGDVVGFAKVTRDVTERHEHRCQLEHLAHYDPLTGLPNRVLLRTKIEEACAQGENVCVLLLDLDGFKDVNDTLGHQAGDLLLGAAAARINAVVTPPATVGRMGGDEFAVVLPAPMDPMQIGALCQQLLDAFRAPFTVEGDTIYLGVSIGVSSSLEASSERTPGAILSDADIALYAAKEERRGGYCFFQPRMRQAILYRRACESDLRTAVAEGRLELFYQPQVRLADRSVFGAEALLRWHHPQRGILSPGAFLSVLERSSLAGTVGQWVIRTACQHASKVRALGYADYRVAVNLFAAQFRTTDLFDVVSEALAAAALPPEALELEITENILLRQDAAIMNLLEQLRGLGVGIAFDDYGTGYASLSVLKKYPLTTLKIDRSFVCELNVSASDVAVVGAILSLGRSFDLKVVAEGIETAQQEAYLINLGCTSGQGYLYDRPTPSEALIRKLSEPGHQMRVGDSGRN
jgi:diguanylate cyclase (GGDEF)-like protein/PAS domain S-box-containing protein